MTSGRFPVLAAVSLAWMQAAWPATTADPAALLRRLARPAPAITPFVEVRFSQLLDRPLVSTGTLEYSSKDHLVRNVSSPFKERTEISADTVTIERGAKRQDVSLSQVPQLRSLVAGFTGLLSGDLDALTQAFELSASGDDSRWQLSLKPKDPGVARRVRSIVVNGVADRMACVTTTETNTNVTVLLLQSPDTVKLPEPLSRAFLERYCSGAAR